MIGTGGGNPWLIVSRLQLSDPGQAACRRRRGPAERNESHVLSKQPHLSNTIYLYQKGKYVMDEPGILPLRSPIPFTAGLRETSLAAGTKLQPASRSMSATSPK